MIEIGAAHLVYAQVTALFGHLRRDNNEASRVDPVEDGALKRSILVFGDASDAECLDDDGIVVALEQLEDARAHLRSQLQHKHALVERIVEMRGVCSRFVVAARSNDAAVADESELRIVYTDKRVEAHGALLAGTRSGDDHPAKDHAHVVGRIVHGIQQALVEVEFGVGEGVGHGLLRARQHDGFGAVLNQVRQGSRGVGHGVRAMQHHKAVVAVIRVHNHVANVHPVARAHVRAVDVHGLHHVDMAQVGRLGNVTQQLVAAQSRCQAATILNGGNRSARGNNQDALFILHENQPFAAVCVPVAQRSSQAAIIAQRHTKFTNQPAQMSRMQTERQSAEPALLAPSALAGTQQGRASRYRRCAAFLALMIHRHPVSTR